jgi:NarL family two-component system response regulator LiaR
VPLRVLIVDDHRVVRRGLVLVLEEDPEIDVIGEAGDGAEAVRLATELLPDVVLMDVVMPVMDGIAATAAIRRELPATQVLALTSALGDHSVVDAVRAGAVGYLVKDATPEEVCQAVKSAAAGTPYLATGVADQLIREIKLPAQPIDGHAEFPSPTLPLTDREVAVLRLLGQGKSNQEIAGALAIGVSTVKSHVHHVLTKLRLPTRTQAALYASEHVSDNQHGSDDG